MATVYNAAMPELPEVQSILQSLQPHIIGRSITRVVCRRRDIVAGSKASDNDLLGRQRVIALRRHGKQFAMLSAHKALVVQLGMSGSLRWVEQKNAPLLKHDHVVWHFGHTGTLRFHDPRRFGGLTPLPDHSSLEQRWSTLGPDALTCQPKALHAKLRQTDRSIKAALLDQQVIAGLGNIYVDELLFASRIHPMTPASQLSASNVVTMVQVMRRILGSAVQAGGSTIRDYVNGVNQPGAYQLGHKVYGRSGQPCVRCGQLLCQGVVIGRTTVFCPQCQGLMGRGT